MIRVASHVSGDFTIIGGAQFVTDENVLFEPFVTDGSVGYVASAPDGTTRIVHLVPSTSHDGTESLADVFLYDDEVSGMVPLTKLEPENAVTYINLFGKDD